MGFRSGFVAVVGRSNVGKSTLVNAFVGEKVAIVSSKPQTTRQRILGVLTRRDGQAVFVDTPGFHRPRDPLGEFMVETIHRALPDADLILLVVDLSEPPGASDRAIAAWLQREASVPLFLVLNKADRVPEAIWEERGRGYRALVAATAVHFISATTGFGRSDLLEAIFSWLPEGPPFFEGEVTTDQTERLVVGELVREPVLELIQAEVPYSVAVRVEDFRERAGGATYIRAVIYVEKESQKGILIGSGGAMLKEIGRRARAGIEALLGRKVFLELWVKVERNWRKNPAALRRLGYPVSRRGGRDGG